MNAQSPEESHNTTFVANFAPSIYVKDKNFEA